MSLKKDYVLSLQQQINTFLTSDKRLNMIIGENYYIGKHDILERKRMVIGNNGKMQEIYNLPNNKIIDNQYARIVDQKNSYLLSKPLTISCDNEILSKCTQKVFNKFFLRLLKNVGEDTLNCGISYLYIFLDDDANLKFKRFKPYEILPIWEDDEHTILKHIVRIYDVCTKKNKIFTRVEIYTKEGIHFYKLEDSILLQDTTKPFKSYLYNSNNLSLCWGKLPIIAFKFNSKEIPLISKVKTLQDSLNTIRSDFMNNMQEDARNTILVLKNYDGTNIEQFRKNLSEYGVVKVKTIDGTQGGVESLKISVDSNNYETLSKALKKAIVENAKGYDAKDEKFGSNLNQMNIKSIYLDIDLDANLMESEFQASFEDLIFFFKKYMSINGYQNIQNENITVIFNRDMIINENEAIDNCIKSKNVLSTKTILAKHPWVSDLQSEIENLKNNI